jgi:tetratricopeptide (TPR) repeat protein
MNRVVLAVVVAVAGPIVSAAAQDQDTVFIAGSTGGHVRVTGEVLDYGGNGLRIRVGGGQERQYPVERILGIETPYTRQQVDGDAAFEVGRFDQAIGFYLDALKQEPRRWVGRQLMARLVRCYDAMGQPERAGNAFAALLQDDPKTPHFDCIPLSWLPSQPSPAMEQLARAWAKSDQPAMALLGASYLLETADRENAMALLRKLAAGPDRRTAQLAAAQTWRAAMVTAQAVQLEAWNRAVEEMPESLAAGPYFVLGSAWAQSQQWEKAALALMRIPILYPQQRALAAQSLVVAAHCLEKLHRTSEAIRLYYEAIRVYPEQGRPIAEARSRVEDLKAAKE